MGSNSWHNEILQALLIGLVVQIVVYVLWDFWAGLWAAWKKRMARPATGEPVSETDVEMGAVNVGAGATIPDNPPHGLAANSGVGDVGYLEDAEDPAGTRASTPEISTIHGSSAHGPAQENESLKMRREEPLCLLWCMFHTRSKSARCWSDNKKPNHLQIPVATTPRLPIADCRMLITLMTLTNL